MGSQPSALASVGSESCWAKRVCTNANGLKVFASFSLACRFSLAISEKGLQVPKSPCQWKIPGKDGGTGRGLVPRPIHADWFD